MFAKDIKIRSNNQIKTSEKKNLLKEVLKQYPTVSEEELKNLIRVKESEISYSKIVTHDSTDLIVYFSDKIPYFFKTEKDDQLVPTVYFLWRFPNVLPKFYTHREVFNRLANGADLMMPGLIVNGPINLYTFKHINKNDLVSICLNGNEAPIAVGRACLSGEDMYMSAMKGRCATILNIYEDNLWALGDKSIKIPLIPPESKIEEKIVEGETENREKQDENADKTEEKEAERTLESESKLLEEQLNLNEEPKTKEEDLQLIDHAKLLEECFLCSIKFRAKEFKLPVIISTFNKIMQTCSPVQFDLKQTPYKKITAFLKEMEKEGLIKTKELQKGVLSITEISKEHEKIKQFKKPDWFKEEMEAKKSCEEAKPSYSVIELYKIDGASDEFFRPTYKRGDILSAAEIRQLTMNYIKQNSLQLEDKPKCVKIDMLLGKLFFKNRYDESVSFEELFQLIFSKLSQVHQIKRDDLQQIVAQKKGKFQPVEFKLESRGGNKKVTCVYNLAPFEIDTILLQNKIKKAISCSVSINEANTGSEDFVLCVQGNQIYHVSEILKNEFGIQLKHMAGLEQAVKP